VPASVGSLLGSAWGVLTYRRHRRDATGNLIAKLQTKQALLKTDGK
jgi:hypothetical protein